MFGSSPTSLGAVGAAGEVGKVGEEAYVPTKVTGTFVIPSLAAGVEFWFVAALSSDLLLPKPEIYPRLAFGRVRRSGMLTT